MRNLFAAEILRLWSRRLVVMLAAVLIGLSALIAVPTGMEARPITAAERADAERELQADLKAWKDECAGDNSQDCVDMKPDLSDYLPETATVEEAMNAASGASGGVGALLFLIIAGTFVAAEFRSGSITTWVVANPNRTMVYLAKLGAAAASIAVVATVSCAVNIAALAGTVTAVGTGFDVPDVAARLALNLAGGCLLAAIGVALGTLTRHTVAVLGVAVGTAIVELFAVVADLVSPSAGILRWLPSTQMAAILSNGVVVDRVEFSSEVRHVVAVSAGEGLVYWTVIAVILTATALALFRRAELR